VIALLLSLPAVPWAGPSQRTQAVTTGQLRLLQIGPDLAARRRSRTDPGPRPCLQARDPGPHWGRIRPEDHGQQRLVTVSRSRRSVAVCERSPRSPDDPDCLSHGGSRLCPRFDTTPIERRMIRTATEPWTQCRGRQAGRVASRPGRARTGFPAGPGSPGRGSVGGRPRYGRGAACPPAPSG
jgi:hypothetical protein